MPSSKHYFHVYPATVSLEHNFRSGYTVTTTCAPEHIDYVKNLGAVAAFDYTKKDVGAQIREFTNNKLRHAWDTVSIEDSAQICADALTTIPSIDPVYGTLLPVKSPREDVRTVSTVMYTVFGKDFKFGPDDIPASREDFEFGKMFYSITERLLSQVWSLNALAGFMHSSVEQRVDV